eukprot:TRINITY_DN7989_c0_g1_i1.p1 TRINITY_DN7989_c0_g1~~TRINITY_DN7989_c0_g1_i1.p1  ORF type:complete len:167 (-),score=36.28 TRINITY_DN7989_c0_g1_i1:15-515(-)
MLNTKLVLLLRKNPDVKCVVIDSIASIFRAEFTKNESAERASLLHLYAHKLKSLSDEYKIPFLTINQVRDKFSDRFMSTSTTTKVEPALGLAWSNSVNMRIIFEKTTSKNYSIPSSSTSDEHPSKKQKISDSSILRKMTVVFAPHIPSNSCYFIIANDGLHGVENN